MNNNKRTYSVECDPETRNLWQRFTLTLQAPMQLFTHIFYHIEVLTLNLIKNLLIL